jgi:hypothetical protein
MDISVAEWLQVALAGLALLTLAVALANTLRLRAVAMENTALSDSETKTIVDLRLLESRVSELETTVVEIERSLGSTDDDSEVIDLRFPLGGNRDRNRTGIVRVPDASR